MKTIKLLVIGGLNEIFQSLDIKFSFVNNDLQQVSSPCKCRDFLADVIYSYKRKKQVNIYGFLYNFNEAPYDLDVTRLSMKFPDKSSYDACLNNLSMLHSKEDEAKVSRTVIHKTQDDLTLLIEGDKAWQSCGWKISLYSFYLKLISLKSIDDIRTPDSVYYKTLVESKKEPILLEAVGTKFKTPVLRSKTMNVIHDNSGFVSILNKKKRSIYKYVLGDSK